MMRLTAARGVISISRSTLLVRGAILSARTFSSAFCSASEAKNSPNLSAKAVKFPINVEALYHQPLRHPQTHKHLVAEVYFSSYGIQNMDFFVDFALRAAYYLGIPITGPKPLPTKRELFTVIKAPFVNSKSKENFERKTHKRLLKAWDSNPEIIDLWLSVLNKHSIAGVGMKSNIFVRESVDALKELSDVNFDIDEAEPYLKGENADLVEQKVNELLKSAVFEKHLK